jgi:hypothetical protein
MFFIVAPSAEQCMFYLENFLGICQNIGIPMAAEKTMGPLTCLTFLGIELDTVNQIARLPEDKLSKCLDLIKEFLHRRKVTLRELQSLCGLLNFECQGVVPVRAFLRRLFDLCRSLRKPHHRVKLTVGVKEDLKVWEQFLIFFNGKCFFMEDNVVSTDMLQLYTDATGRYGYGALLETSWFYGEWNESWENVDITIKELYPIVLAV